jgi:quinol monooxygenase YgiN
MLTVVLVAKIKPGLEQQFEAQIARLSQLVRANEPGCKLVQWGVSETPGTYVFYERFVDRAALEAHRAAPHEKELGPLLADMFDGAPTIVRFIERD